MSATDDCEGEDARRADGQTDGRSRRRPSSTERAEVGLDTPGRIGAYGQRRSRPRDTSEGAAAGKGRVMGG